MLGRGRQPVGQIQARHLAEGMVPSTLWQPGQVWRDRIVLERGTAVEEHAVAFAHDARLVVEGAGQRVAE